MIEKMKFVSIMGPIDDMDRAKDLYLSDCEIQIEDAVTEMGQSKNVTSFPVVNSYAEVLRKAEHFASIAGVEAADKSHLSGEEAVGIVEEINEYIKDADSRLSDIGLEKKHYEEMLGDVLPFIDLDYPLEKFSNFSFIRHRFGKIPINSYRQYEAYLSDMEGIFLEQLSADRDYVYCMVFIPHPLYDKVNAVLTSLHFEGVSISKDIKGSPAEAYKELKAKIKDMEIEIKELETERVKKLSKRSSDIPLALRKLRELNSYHDMKRLAAKTKDDFYIIVGWMTERNAKKLEKKVKSDEKVIVILADNNDELLSSPPTKLKNFPFFKPFENLSKRIFNSGSRG